MEKFNKLKRNLLFENINFNKMQTIGELIYHNDETISFKEINLVGYLGVYIKFYFVINFSSETSVGSQCFLL